MSRGKFITIDGLEGAGKSTQIDFIKKYLSDRNRDVFLTREPGGTDLGERLRALLLDKKIDAMNPDTELLLMFAARNEHVKKVIVPKLEQGVWVISDRFTDASYAYQGGGRRIPLERIGELEQWTLQDFVPDMTFLLDLDVELGLSRVEQRGEKDRFEEEHKDFFNKVREIFSNRASKYPERIKLIDASKNIDETSSQIKKILDLL
ncbi:dTMP kinase [Gammaproteobacteria bacterium]|jgi:dTMP kinase|nr:dTMP kinase [Gammaproteobacteria bacterium]